MAEAKLSDEDSRQMEELYTQLGDWAKAFQAETGCSAESAEIAALKKAVILLQLQAIKRNEASFQHRVSSLLGGG